MSVVYHQFEPNDLLSTVVRTKPLLQFASGTGGWSGNVGASSSLSLYGGVRGRYDVYHGSPSGLEIYPLDLLDTMSIDKVISVSGSYPATGSVQYLKIRNVEPSNYFTDLNSENLYDEHFTFNSRIE